MVYWHGTPRLMVIDAHMMRDLLYYLYTRFHSEYIALLFSSRAHIFLTFQN